ncbi:MAG: type II toxin-antitoxin system RelE/ParE family toxin [Deltaproteobacteria bacterium]|nr:type II toxin-antitoxin system RelE/ParE family toxin [Deltaproteobacteria bacterium]
MRLNVNSIFYYESREGRTPFIEWLESLKDRDARAKIKVRIDRVRLGNFGEHRSVQDGVWELIVDYGPGYRVYYGKIGMNVVLLLCAGTKKRQQKDIEIAKEFWQDYRKRNNA